MKYEIEKGRFVELPDSKLVKNQKVKYSKDKVMVDGQEVAIAVSIRFDDQCGNGHNTFSITGDMWEADKPHTDRYNLGGGCIHEAIEEAFPELKKYIKWHLTSTNGPWGYLANTLYHARDMDHRGKRKGEPWAWDTAFKFGDFPILWKCESRFAGYLGECLKEGNKFDFEVLGIKHDKEDWIHYYWEGDVVTKWHEAPFKSEEEALHVLEAFQRYKVEVVKVPTFFSEGKEIELDAARNSAVWKDATLGELQDKEKLIQRLPELMQEFKKDMEALGFEY